MSEDRTVFAQQFVVKDRLGSLIGARLLSLTTEECLYEYTARPEHYNPNGILHGGALYTAMDSSQGLLVCSTLDPAFKTAATGTATIKYLAPLKSETVRIRTVITQRERRKIFVRSEAMTPEGTVVAVLEEIWIGIS
jgi:uncharacterized protein (TIGR00369 family)